jgi:hypothetical protein
MDYLFHFEDGGESNGIFASDVFRLLSTKLSIDGRLDAEIFDWTDGEENVE